MSKKGRRMAELDRQARDIAKKWEPEAQFGYIMMEIDELGKEIQELRKYTMILAFVVTAVLIYALVLGIVFS